MGMNDRPEGRVSGGSLAADPLEGMAWWLMVAAVMSSAFSVVRVGQLAVADLLFVGSAALFGLSAARRPSPSATFQVALVLGAIAVVAVSPAADDTVASVGAGARLLFVWSVLQWALRGLSTARERQMDLVAALCIGAAVSGLVGFLQNFAGLDVPGATVMWGRASGLQAHPNGQGGLLAVAAPMALVLATSRGRRTVGVISLSCSLVGLVMSGSVTGMIGAASGLVTVLFLRKTSAATMAVAVLAVVGAAFFVSRLAELVPGAASPLKRFADTTGNGSGVSTLDSRLWTMEHAFDHIRAHPLSGVGLDTASGATYNDLTLTHNIFLLQWYQGGPLLLIAVLVVILGVVPRALSLAYTSGSAPAIAVVGGAGAALIVALTGPVLYDRWFWLPVLLCSALLSSRGHEPAHHPLKTVA